MNKKPIPVAMTNAKTIIEDIRVTGAELIDRIRELIHEGNVKRISVRNTKGDVLVDVPVSIGVAGLGATFLAMGPLITALGFFALFMNDYSIFVEREEPIDEHEVNAQFIEVEDEDEEDEEEEDEKEEGKKGKNKK